MLPQSPVGGVDVVLVAVEPGEPVVQVGLVLQLLYGLHGDPALGHVADHTLCADLLRPAVGVADDHYVHHSEFVDGDQHGSHGLAVGVGHPPSGVLYEDDVAVIESERRREQMHQAGVHARYHGGLEAGVLGRGVLMVLFVLDEFPVVLEDRVDHISSHLTLESSSAASRESSASRRAGLNVPGPLHRPSASSAATLNADMAAATDSTDAPQAPA